jgi:hypothetical protein
MAGHHLIAAYLDGLRRRLPADAVDELADGLLETFDHRLATGVDADTAARQAIAEFGDVDTIHAAFTRHSPGRRLAIRLLATGPAVGACWAGTLLLGHAWTWPVPGSARLAFGLALLATVATLGAAAGTRRNSPRTRIAALGGLGLVVLDATMIATTLVAAPVLVWPMAAAIPASLLRIGATLRAVPTILHHRSP